MTLYSLLNADAKAWWYYKRLREWGRHAEARALERKSMRSDIASVRKTSWNGGYMLVTADDRFNLIIGEMEYLTGYGTALHLQRLCEMFDVPVFNLANAPEGNSLIWNEPRGLLNQVTYYKEKCHA